MYESPITLITNKMQATYEDGIMKAIQSVGVSVNKEELVKALEYDRNQYEKGYRDAERYIKCEVLDKIRAEIIELDIFYDNDYFSGNKDAMVKRNEVLQIIDKYKESEE